MSETHRALLDVYWLLGSVVVNCRIAVHVISAFHRFSKERKLRGISVCEMFLGVDWVMSGQISVILLEDILCVA